MTRKQAIFLALALLVPLFVYTILVALIGVFFDVTKVPSDWQNTYALGAPIVSAVLGFVCLASQLRRRTAVIIAFVYFPAMIYLLFSTTLGLAGLFYGEYL